MAVANDGGLARRMQPVTINQRMPGGGHDLDVFQADGTHLLRHELSRPPYIIFMFGKSADTGDAQQVFQFAEKTRLLLTGIINGKRTQSVALLEYEE